MDVIMPDVQISVRLKCTECYTGYRKTGRNLCSRCCDKLKDYRKQIQYEKCRLCNNIPTRGKKACDNCLQYESLQDYRKQIQYEKCRLCSNIPPKGKKTCEICKSHVDKVKLNRDTGLYQRLLVSHTIVDGKKQCSCCKQSSSIDMFCLNSRKDNKLNAICKHCSALSNLVSGCRTSCKTEQHGLKCDVNLKYIKAMTQTLTHCPALGVPLQYGGSKMCDNSATVDSIIPRRHLKDNICIISSLANRVKSNATPADIATVGLKMTKYVHTLPTLMHQKRSYNSYDDLKEHLVIPDGLRLCSFHREIHNSDQFSTVGATPAHCTLAQRITRMYQTAKKRAKKKGLEFSLTLELIEALYDKTKSCPIFIDMLLKSGKGRVCATSPTIDRIVSSLGYVPGNVWIISHKANCIKTNATSQQILRVALWLDSLEVYDDSESLTAQMIKDIWCTMTYEELFSLPF